MTRAFTAEGLLEPLYFFACCEEGGILTALGYTSEADLPEGARLSGEGCTITLLEPLQAGLYFVCDTPIPNQLTQPIAAALRAA